MSKRPIRLCASYVLAVVLLGAGCRPSPGSAGRDEETAELFQKLHERLYGVYALGTDRDLIWDLLSSSFAGDALTQQYVEHFTTLTQMSAEQTAIEVLQVDYEHVEIVERDADRIVVDADWSVGGIVTHQRHKHPRVNRYRALYTLASNDGGVGYRIVDTRMRNLERVRSLIDSHDFPLDEIPQSARGLLGPAELLRSGVLTPDELSPRDEEDEP